VLALRQIKKSSKNLVRIENAELSHTLSDIDLLKAEKKSIEEAIDVANAKALAELGDTEAAYVHGYGKAYQLPSQANYVDARRLKAEDPETYEKYFVSRLTGEHFLRTYPEKSL
jgi:predicted phage-related endonuclease